MAAANIKPLRRKNTGKTALAVLLDPDKPNTRTLEVLRSLSGKELPDLFLLGGSLLTQNFMGELLEGLAAFSDIPKWIFPGDAQQIHPAADAFLNLFLASGRNPEYLIGQHVRASFALKNSGLEVLPTAYLLLDGGQPTSASYITNSQPLPAHKPALAAATALACVQLGFRQIYLEAGSGALNPVNPEIILAVREAVGKEVLLFVGGGLRSPEALKDAAQAGADICVVGTAFEEKPELLPRFKEALH